MAPVRECRQILDCGLFARSYAGDGPPVILIHGGPGVAGYMAPVARALCPGFFVIEPYQCLSGAALLTVDRHIDDLRRLIDDVSAKGKPALVGHSWGAMLALAVAARFPSTLSAIALIGCGTFDTIAREELGRRREARVTDDIAEMVDRAQAIADPNQRLRALGNAYWPVDTVDPIVDRLEAERYDAVGMRQSWDDMLHRQRRGEYPADFQRIRCPVLMLHGTDDPHPGDMIRDSLLPVVPHLHYRALEGCGHYPWLERFGSDIFFAALHSWLEETVKSGAGAVGHGYSRIVRPERDEIEAV